MKTFIILDSLCARHGTIKAESRYQALEIFLGREPTISDTLSFMIILGSELAKIQKNIQTI